MAITIAANSAFVLLGAKVNVNYGTTTNYIASAGVISASGTSVQAAIDAFNLLFTVT